MGEDFLFAKSIMDSMTDGGDDPLIIELIEVGDELIRASEVSLTYDIAIDEYAGDSILGFLCGKELLKNKRERLMARAGEIVLALRGVYIQAREVRKESGTLTGGVNGSCLCDEGDGA